MGVNGIASPVDVAVTGLKAESLRLNVVANNIANASTTRTAEGGPYRRQVVSFEAALHGPQIALPEPPSTSPQALRTAPSGDGPRLLISHQDRMHVLPAGVEVGQVQDDASDFQVVYDPTHPDADANGYVKMPNVNPVVEMMDLMSASRAYEANVTAIGVARDMAAKALEIGR